MQPKKRIISFFIEDLLYGQTKFQKEENPENKVLSLRNREELVPPQKKIADCLVKDVEIEGKQLSSLGSLNFNIQQLDTPQNTNSKWTDKGEFFEETKSLLPKFTNTNKV